MSGNTREPGRSVVSKMAAILANFATGPSHSMVELAHHTGLATSTVHRLLQVLVNYELLERTDNHDYRAGSALRKLQVKHCPPTILSRGPFVVDDLADVLHTVARLGVPKGSQIIYVQKGPQAAPGTSFRYSTGLAVQTTATVKVLLAFADSNTGHLRVPIESPIASSRRHSVRNEATRSVLRRIRSQGFAVSARKQSGSDVGAVAVPVFDVTHRAAVAALEVETPDLEPRTLAKTIPCLAFAARRLSQEVASNLVL